MVDFLSILKPDPLPYFENPRVEFQNEMYILVDYRLIL